MDTHKQPLFILVVIAVLAFLAYAVSQNKSRDDAGTQTILSYEQCVAAGYPIAESFPRQCIVPDGKSFTNQEDLAQWREQTGNTVGATAKDGCVVTGCSGQVCAEEEMITTCEFRPEYACFKETHAVCGKQADGKCGWNQLPELLACYQKAFNQSGASQPIELSP